MKNDGFAEMKNEECRMKNESTNYHKLAQIKIIPHFSLLIGYAKLKVTH